MLKVIQNSGGRSSAYMTERLLKDKNPEDQYLILFQNTGRERNETLEFLHKCELRWQEMYNETLIWLEYSPDRPGNFKEVNFEMAHRINSPGKSPFEKLIEKRKNLPNRVMRTCTRDLKIRVAANFTKSLGYQKWISLIGIRFDEPKRHVKKPAIRERYTVEFPMVEWKTTVQDVDYFWKGMPFDLGLAKSEGNCDLCFLKGLGKLKRLIRKNPGSADWWVKMETAKSATFRADLGYKEILNGIKNSPEFEFTDDFECDTPCHCFID